jgi:hypothetical protein
MVLKRVLSVCIMLATLFYIGIAVYAYKMEISRESYTDKNTITINVTIKEIIEEKGAKGTVDFVIMTDELGPTRLYVLPYLLTNNDDLTSLQRGQSIEVRVEEFSQNPILVSSLIVLSLSCPNRVLFTLDDYNAHEDILGKKMIFTTPFIVLPLFLIFIYNAFIVFNQSAVELFKLRIAQKMIVASRKCTNHRDPS